MYKHKHGVDMGTVAAAQLLSNTLYYRRFFPIYALAVIAGLDSEGRGYVAGYVSSLIADASPELTELYRMLSAPIFDRGKDTAPMVDLRLS